MDTILKKFGLKYSDLNQDELQTLDKMYQSITRQSLTIGDVKEYISQMIYTIEDELVGNNVPKNLAGLLYRKRRKRHLEARLQNYILLRMFLTAPERAQKFVEAQLERIASNK